jgi:hypothetical protein
VQALHRALGQGIVGPLRRINDDAHNPPNPIAIYLPDLAGGNQSIKLISLHSGNCFVFLTCPFEGIVDQSAVEGTVHLKGLFPQRAQICAIYARLDFSEMRI